MLIPRLYGSTLPEGINVQVAWIFLGGLTGGSIYFSEGKAEEGHQNVDVELLDRQGLEPLPKAFQSAISIQWIRGSVRAFTIGMEKPVKIFSEICRRRKGYEQGLKGRVLK